MILSIIINIYLLKNDQREGIKNGRIIIFICSHPGVHEVIQ